MKVIFSDIFTGDYLAVMAGYKERIQYILECYDIAIFMARKAICFYTAMRINGELADTDCHVVSSRVVDYDFLQRFRGKRVAVIDDVVVKGRSLEEVASKLQTEGVEADYFVAACEAEFAEQFYNGIKINKSYTHYKQSDIYQLAGLITQYIEASMCSFNIDSPIYHLEEGEGDIQRFLDEKGATVLTGSLQKKFGISSRAVYLKISENEDNKEFFALFDRSVFKIRVYYNEERVICVPFVLFEAMGREELDRLYGLVKCSALDTLVVCDGERLRDENKLKIISYLFSAALMSEFAERYGFHHKRYIGVDWIQFDCDLEKNVGEEIKVSLRKLVSSFEMMDYDFDSGIFSGYFKAFYGYIGSMDLDNLPYENCNGGKISANNTNNDRLARTVFTYGDLLGISDMGTDADRQVYLSSVIDVLIDMGMIVPSVVHLMDGGIVRAYKMGEYSKLSRDQINAFASMLLSYQTNINRNLDKTEFEKLCVLFFQKSINERVFQESVNYEDGMYGICYSLYGPRVSTGDVRYAVDTDSALITDFLDSKIVRRQNGKYFVDKDVKVGDDALMSYCNYFALICSRLEKLFEEHPYNPHKNPWNQWVHTYDQYLTLFAIGKSQKNQVLSLCAELYQLLQIDEAVLWKDAGEIQGVGKYRLAISGINSGLWKYRCYKADAFDKTNRIIREYSGEEVLGPFAPMLLAPYDLNQSLTKMIDKCGEVLYKAAFFLNSVLKAKGQINAYRIKRDIDGFASKAKDDGKLLFQRANYYGAFADLRREIEGNIKDNAQAADFDQATAGCFCRIKKEAQSLLEWCDLYIETNSVDYRSVKDFVVAYSPSGSLPQNVKHADPVTVEHVSDSRKLHIYPIYPEIGSKEIEQMKVSLEEELRQVDDLKIILCYLDKGGDEFIQVGNKAKGSNFRRFMSDALKVVAQHCSPHQKNRMVVSRNNSKVEPDGLDNNTVKTYIVNNNYSIYIYQENNGEVNMATGDTYKTKNQGSVGAQAVGDNAKVIVKGDIVGAKVGMDESQLKILFDAVRNAARELNGVERKQAERYVDIVEGEMKEAEPDKGIISGGIEKLKKISGNETFQNAVAAIANISGVAGTVLSNMP